MGAKKFGMTEKKWDDYVRKARALTIDRDKIRFRVAELAIEACAIYRGGSEKKFSLARFALEIGISKNTLSDWVRAKQQVVDKLPKAIAQKTDQIPYSVIDRCLTRVGPRSTPSEVKAIYMEESGTDPIVIRFKNYSQSVSNVLHNAKRPYKLVGVPSALLKEIHDKCIETAAFLEKEIVFRNTHRKREFGTSANVKEVINKAKSIMKGES